MWDMEKLVLPIVLKGVVRKVHNYQKNRTILYEIIIGCGQHFL